MKTLLARAAARSLRFVGLEKAGWNLLFKNGVAFGGPSPRIAALVERLAGGGLIVEHGCGVGDLPHHFTNPHRYIGYDISSAAVELAAAKAKPGWEFRCRPMEEWSGENEKATLILCKEAIYYLRPDAIVAFIRRARAALMPGGHLVVTIHDPRKWAAVVAMCEGEGLHRMAFDGPLILSVSA
jgi:SAM-dependent methyltransferase